MEAEWVVYNGETGGPNAHKVYCESWEDWVSYKRRNPAYIGQNELVARRLTEDQARAMVQMTQED
jgi:hypothetical protein